MKEKNFEKLIAIIKNTAQVISKQLGFNHERIRKADPKGKSQSESCVSEIP
jgi:hypothetical protein